MISYTMQTTGAPVPGDDLLAARLKPTCALVHGTRAPFAAQLQLVAVLGADVPTAPPPRGAPV